jgi:transposase, IS6 family
MERRLCRHLKPTNDSWRVDETYIRVKGKWRYLYRAVDSSGTTLDFLLSARQDAAAAKRFLAKALGRQNHPVPRVINTDKHAAYPPAIVQLKDEGVLEENCRHRPVQYLNNVLEQDHRAIKRRINASQPKTVRLYFTISAYIGRTASVLPPGALSVFTPKSAVRSSCSIYDRV